MNEPQRVIINFEYVRLRNSNAWISGRHYQRNPLTFLHLAFSTTCHSSFLAGHTAEDSRKSPVRI